jgi:hypothetical protein
MIVVIQYIRQKTGIFPLPLCGGTREITRFAWWNRKIFICYNTQRLIVMAYKL